MAAAGRAIQPILCSALRGVTGTKRLVCTYVDMAKNASKAADGLEVFLFGYLLFIVALASALGMAIYTLGQPRQLGNPGLAAYAPPPATRLVPQTDRKFDAPPIVANAEPEPALTFAHAPVVQTPAPPVRKKSAAKIPQPQNQAANQYFQPMELGNRPWF